jgi:serine/threonine protein kinase
VIHEGQHLDVINPDVLPFMPIKHLGMGGSASVEMIQLKTNGWQLAHKIFRKFHGQRLDEAKQIFRNEIDIIKRLSPHPHIIRVFATYTCGRTLGMLLAPVADNGDLGTYLQMVLDSENLPTAEQTTILESSFGCLANGLAFIHKHTVRHKDIKPQNILIHKGRVIYTDFGIALDASQQENTTTVGDPGAFTRRYCAPEVANWEKRNRKSDVFSLGCVFLEILAVLEPQIGLGAFHSNPYWMNIESIRDILDHSSTGRPGRDQILDVCYDMLEPNHEDRSSAAALLRQMDLLWNPWSDPVFKCFCTDCTPRGEPETVGAEAALLARQQRSEETVALSASSSSISHLLLGEGGAITQRCPMLQPNCSRGQISGKLRGKEAYGITGYRQSLPGSTFSPASDSVEFELEDILVDDGALNNEVAMGLIKNLKIPSPTTNPPPISSEVLFPAHLVFIATSLMWNHGFVKESKRFLDNIIQSIQQEVAQRDGDEAVTLGAFWLSNVHEMLSFIFFFAEDCYGQQRTGSHEYDHLLEIVQHDLESLEVSIQHIWMKMLKRKLHKMIVPAVVESQSLPGFVADSSGFLGKLLQPGYSMDNLLGLLNNVYKAMKAFYLEDTIITMTLTEMLRLVNVTAFNDMLMRRNFLTWKRGLQINYNVTKIEEWCKSHDLPECRIQIEHLMQATKVLQLKKTTLNDIEIIQDICWMLSPNQIQKLLDQYLVTSYDQPINCDFMKAIASRVTEKSNALLPAVDMVDSGPYEIAEPRAITALETYTPSCKHMYFSI